MKEGSNETSGTFAVVTGSSRGSVRRLPNRFSKSGASIVLHGGIEKRSRRSARVSRNQVGSATFVTADLTKRAEIETMRARD